MDALGGDAPGGGEERGLGLREHAVVRVAMVDRSYGGPAGAAAVLPGGIGENHSRPSPAARDERRGQLIGAHRAVQDHRLVAARAPHHADRIDDLGAFHPCCAARVGEGGQEARAARAARHDRLTRAGSRFTNRAKTMIRSAAL
jgi:hypothetical protein